MYFASDTGSGVAPEIMAALQKANQGFQPSYGADALSKAVTESLRALFEAPEAAVYLVTTGTAANALALAHLCPPWATIYCQNHAHIAEDECGAPEFYTHGAKLSLIPSTDGKLSPTALQAALARTDHGSPHSVQRGVLSLANVTETGSVYAPAEIAALTAVAKDYGIPSYLDGARFANALAATGASPAEMSWRAGIDAVSFGATKNGCMGVEAVVIFDPARAFEFELRRKRGAHLLAKHRYLAAQFEAYLADDLWLTLAKAANAQAQALKEGLAALPGTGQSQPVDANVMFPYWPEGLSAKLRAAGATFHDAPTEAPKSEAARLVTSWSTTSADVEAFLSVVRAG